MVSWHNFGCLSCISVAIIQGIFESPRISCFSIFFQKTYLSAFLAFLLKPCNQETPLGVVCRVKEDQTSPEMLVYWPSQVILITKGDASQHFDQNGSIHWILCVTYTTGKQLNWPKFGWNVFTMMQASGKMQCYKTLMHLVIPFAYPSIYSPLHPCSCGNRWVLFLWQEVVIIPQEIVKWYSYKPPCLYSINY